MWLQGGVVTVVLVIVGCEATQKNPALFVHLDCHL